MKKTYLTAFGAIFFWSTVAVTTKLLLGNHSNFQVLWISVLLAGIFLLAVNAATGKLKILKTYKPRDYAISALIGLPGTFLYYMFSRKKRNYNRLLINIALYKVHKITLFSL